MEIKRVTKVEQSLINRLNKTFIKGSSDGKSGEWDLGNARKFVSNPDNIFLLAYENGNIAGMNKCVCTL